MWLYHMLTAPFGADAQKKLKEREAAVIKERAQGRESWTEQTDVEYGSKEVFLGPEDDCACTSIVLNL